MTAADYTLAYGTHATPEEGRCAMEWVSHLAGEPHSDSPTCVSPVLRAICISLNDGLPDDSRQRLRPYLARTIHTAGDGLDAARGWLAMDWLVRTYTPCWLAVAEQDDDAARLAAADAMVDDRSLRAWLPALERARTNTRAARRRVFADEPDPLSRWMSAVRDGRAGREAAWACAGSAAWAAARLAIGDGVGDRVRAAMRGIAGDGAAIAMHRLASDEVCGRLSGRDARTTALGPTLEALADSAVDLLDRMLVTEPLVIPAPAAVLTHA